jgi:hypothetical protein
MDMAKEQKMTVKQICTETHIHYSSVLAVIEKNPHFQKDPAFHALFPALQLRSDVQIAKNRILDGHDLSAACNGLVSPAYKIFRALEDDPDPRAFSSLLAKQRATPTHANQPDPSFTSS